MFKFQSFLNIPFGEGRLIPEHLSLIYLERVKLTPCDSGQMRWIAVSSAHGLPAQGGGCDMIHKAPWVIRGKKKEKAVGCLCPFEGETSYGSHRTVQLACSDAP